MLTTVAVDDALARKQITARMHALLRSALADGVVDPVLEKQTPSVCRAWYEVDAASRNAARSMDVIEACVRLERRLTPASKDAKRKLARALRDLEHNSDLGNYLRGLDIAGVDDTVVGAMAGRDEQRRSPRRFVERRRPAAALSSRGALDRSAFS